MVGISSTNTGTIGTSGNGWGVVGNATNSDGVFGGVYGSSSANGTGVYGAANTGSGVYGSSSSAAGVYGVSTSNVGVYGLSTSSHGVFGSSSNEHGVVGVSNAANMSGVVGYVASGNPNGVAATFNGPVNITGLVNLSGSLTAQTPLPNGHSIIGWAAQSGAQGVWGYAAVANSSGVVGGVAKDGGGNPLAGTYAGFFDGPFLVVGGNKSAAVPFPDGSHRLLYCVESPEAWFEDFGEGTLSAGSVTIALDPDFATTIDTSKLHVFLTPHAASGNALAVTQRTATGFTVTEQGGGKSAGGFTYRVVAKRKDVASPRLAKVTLPTPTLPAAPPPPLTVASLPAAPSAPQPPKLPDDLARVTALPPIPQPPQVQMLNVAAVPTSASVVSPSSTPSAARETSTISPSTIVRGTTPATPTVDLIPPPIPPGRP